MAKQTLTDIIYSLPKPQINKLLDDCLTIGLVLENQGEETARQKAIYYSHKYPGVKRKKIFTAIANHPNLEEFIDALIESV